MYAQGIGIDKNLKKSALILRKASASNIPGSEAELMRVEKAYAIEKTQKKKAIQEANRKKRLEKQKTAAMDEQKQIESRQIQLRKQRALRKKKRLKNKKINSLKNIS